MYSSIYHRPHTCNCYVAHNILDSSYLVQNLNGLVVPSSATQKTFFVAVECSSDWTCNRQQLESNRLTDFTNFTSVRYHSLVDLLRLFLGFQCCHAETVKLGRVWVCMRLNKLEVCLPVDSSVEVCDVFCTFHDWMKPLLIVCL